MGALVVYESMFGGTRAVAEAVAAGLEDAGVATRTVEVGAADERLGDDVTLLVVGGPTHWFGMTRAGSRTTSHRMVPGGSAVSEGVGVREWLDGLDLAGRPVPVAAFATIMRPNLPGSAAHGIARRLRRAGGRRAAPARSFRVAGMTDGPKRAALDAARAWGAELALASS
jgi:hypothetical protein